MLCIFLFYSFSFTICCVEIRNTSFLICYAGMVNGKSFGERIVKKKIVTTTNRQNKAIKCCVSFVLVLFSLNVLNLLLILTNASEEKIKLQLENDKLYQQRQQNDFVWHSTINDLYFYKSGELWIEKHNSEDVEFEFKEELIDSHNFEVVLKDVERDMMIKLTPSSSLLKQGSGDFSLIYVGDWELFNGSPVEGDEDEVFEIDKKYKTPPKPTISKSDLSKTTIVVLLAAYRDPLCGNSLNELFKNAKYPDRVSASVAQQNDEEDIDCLEEYCRLDLNCRRNQVTIINVVLEKARGVMPGRYHQLRGMKNEEFCLQIDAHSVFEDNWDIIALEDWLVLDNEMAVLTTYPNRAKDKHKQKFSPVRCSTKFSNKGQLVHGGNSAHNVKFGKEPFLQPFFGAGIGFSKCHANWNVPYDPYMSFLFGGEEFNRAARLYTWGYDLYAPRRNFVYHYYDDDLKDDAVEKPDTSDIKKRHREFFKDKDHLGSQTTLRWRTVLGLPLDAPIKDLALVDINLYGLGNRRTLKQYEKFSGVNLRAAVATDRCNKIGKMKRVPYVYDTPFYPGGKSNCDFISQSCCNSLKLSIKNSLKFLDLTNREVSSLLKESNPASNSFQRRDEPYISPFATGDYSHEKSCDSLDLEEIELN